MISVNVNTSELERRLERYNQRATASGLAAAKVGAEHFVQWMNDFAPMDTGRYKRAWIEAGNAAGLTRRPLPRLIESRWKVKFEKALDAQIDRYIKKLERIYGVLDAWYYSKGRPLRKAGRKLEAEANRYKRRLAAAVEQKRRFLGAEAPVLVFDLFSNGRSYRAANGKSRFRRLTTVRDKIYGGDGKVLIEEGEGRVRLINREPHVRLVERRYRLIARANAAVRTRTDAHARRVFRRELEG